MQPFRRGNVIFHGFVHVSAADHQHMSTAQKVAGNVDAVLVFLRDGVVEEKRQGQNRADRRKARVVDFAAILRRILGVFDFIRAPRGGDVCEGSFHDKNSPSQFFVGHENSPRWTFTVRAGRFRTCRD